MKIEIHRPELEKLIRERMEHGEFQSVEDALMDALKTPPSAQPSPRRSKKPPGQFLLESPLRGSGLNLERRQDYPRPTNL